MPPTFERSELPQIDAESLEIAFAQEPTDTLAEEWPSESWWESFEDPQLSRIMEIALSNNPSIQERACALMQTVAQVDQSIANQLPSINVDPSLIALKYARDGELAPFVLPGMRLSNLLKQIIFKTQWLLDIWGQVSSTTAAAEALATQREAEVALQRLMVSAQSAKAYISLQASQKKQQLYQERLQALRWIESLKLERKTQAVAAITAVQQAQLMADGAEQDSAQSTLEREQIGHLLKQIVASNDFKLSEIEPVNLANINIPERLVPRSLPLELISRRPDIKVALWQVETAARRVQVQRTAWYPNIDLLAGNFGMQALDIAKLLDPGSFKLGLGPAISLPWFDGGSRDAKYSEALSTYQEAVAAYHSTILKATREVLDALSKLNSTKKVLEIAKQSFATQQELMHTTTLLQKGGLIDKTTVLSQKAGLLESEIAYYDSLEQMLMAVIDLQVNLGA